MPQKDLLQFIKKVEQLKKMVDLIEKDTDKRKILQDCETHDEVVKLAKSWGFEIGRRWGE